MGRQIDEKEIAEAVSETAEAGGLIIGFLRGHYSLKELGEKLEFLQDWERTRQADAITAGDYDEHEELGVGA